MTVTSAVRLTWIDRLRGLAIVLMVVDHVLVLADPDNVLRFTATRLSLPLFVGCAFVLDRGGRLPRDRVQLLAAAAVVESVLNVVIGLGVPGPVTLIALALLASTHRRFRPYLPLWGLLGLLQALYVPLGWSGYEPGLIVAWAALAPAAIAQVREQADRLPAWLGALGARPLAWYVGHLAVLAGVVLL